MIEILDNAHQNFEQEKQDLVNQINMQKAEIDELKEQNEALTQFSQQNQSKIEDMVRIYTE